MIYAQPRNLDKRKKEKKNLYPITTTATATPTNAIALPIALVLTPPLLLWEAAPAELVLDGLPFPLPLAEDPLEEPPISDPGLLLRLPLVVVLVLATPPSINAGTPDLATLCAADWYMAMVLPLGALMTPDMPIWQCMAVAQ